MRQPRSPVDRAETLAAVRERLAVVRLRFGVSLDDLASRIVELADQRLDPADSSVAFLERLSLDDLYLATACARGDEAAWEEFGARFFAFIRDFSRKALREPRASDVADQVIADLWQHRKIGRYEGRSTLRTWLGAVVAHAGLNAVKLKGPTAAARLDAHASFAGRDPVEAIAGRDAGVRLASWVADGIGQLPPADQLLLLLHYEQELTLAEISPIVGASTPTVSRRLARIRQRLCEHVESLAARETGDTPDGLRGSIEFGRIELDLSAVFARMKRKGGSFV